MSTIPLTPRSHALWLLAAASLLSGCIYLPRTTENFDRDCRMVSRQMVLEEVQIGEIRGCSNQGCAALVVAAGVTAAASVVISGSIVVVGNIAYWLERQVQCQRAPEAAPMPAAPAAAPSREPVPPRTTTSTGGAAFD